MRFKAVLSPSGLTLLHKGELLWRVQVELCVVNGLCEVANAIRGGNDDLSMYRMGTA